MLDKYIRLKKREVTPTAFKRVFDKEEMNEIVIKVKRYDPDTGAELPDKEYAKRIVFLEEEKQQLLDRIAVIDELLETKDEVVGKPKTDTFVEPIDKTA